MVQVGVAAGLLVVAAVVYRHYLVLLCRAVDPVPPVSSGIHEKGINIITWYYFRQLNINA